MTQHNQSPSNSASKNSASSNSAPTFSASTALIVVDMQHDFADRSGSLFVSGGDSIVAVVNDHIATAAKAGAFVVYTQDWHPEETPHFVTGGGVWPVHCVRDTWGANLCDALTIAGPVVRKGTNGEDGYSGFTMRDPLTGREQPTELNDLLIEKSVTDVVVVGLALDVCVKATALDAVTNGYSVVVLLDACRAVDLEPGDGDRAVTELKAAGCAVS